MMDMNQIWAAYEAEKAAGDMEAADIIGDVYTALDMIETDGASADEDMLLKTYTRICRIGFQREGLNFGPLFEIRMALENAMTQAGFLEADEEEPEEAYEYDSETNRDELMADLLYEEYRDRALMGYER